MPEPDDYGPYAASNYGLLFYKPRMFAGAADYALGALILSRPEKVRETIDTLARSYGYEVPEALEKTWRDFEKGVQKREGARNVLRIGLDTVHPDRGAVIQPRLYQRTLEARIKTKSRSGPEYVRVVLNKTRSDADFPYQESLCPQDAALTNEHRIKAAMCAHTAALHLTAWLGTSKPARVREFLPEGMPESRMPYAFLRDAIQTGKAWFDYYARGQTKQEIGVGLLATPEALSDGALEAVREDRAGLQPLRARSLEAVHGADVRRRENQHGANLERTLQARGFHRDGYAREFIGTAEEGLARRWRNGPQVVHLIRGKDHPLLLVKRWLTTEEGWTHDLFGARVGPGEKYDSLDDVTRRVAHTEITLPEVPGVPIPKELAGRYRNA